ncbi:hypothetical protein MTO96_035659 [Rhipicephalus appendiculatus]
MRNAEALEDDEQSDNVADATLNTDYVWYGLTESKFVTATDTFQEFVDAGGSELSVCEEASVDDTIIAAVRGSAEPATDDEADGKGDVNPTPEPDFPCKDTLEYLTKDAAPTEDQEPDADLHIEGWEDLGTQASAQDFVTADDNVATCGLRSVEELADEAKETESDSDGEDADVCDVLPSTSENHHALQCSAPHRKRRQRE